MRDKKEKLIFKNIAHYSSSKIYRQFLGIFTAFIRPRLLTPELYGLWGLLNIIPLYASYFHLGSRTSMRYRVPFYAAAREDRKADEITNSVFRGSLVLNFVPAVAIAIFAFALPMDFVVRAGLLTMSCVIILKWYYEYHLAHLKSYQNFKLISASNYVITTVTCVFSICLIYFFNIYGAYMTIIIAHVIVILYLRARHPLKLRSPFNRALFIDLIRGGFPIMIFSLCALLISTSDRIIVAVLLGREQLGYYGIAVMVFGFLMNVPGAAREVVEPKLMENLGKDVSDEHNLREYFFRPLLNTAYLMPFLIGPVLFIVPLVIPLFLPRYVPGIIPAQIIALGSYFLAMSYVARGIIVAKGLQLKASIIIFFALFMNIIVSVILIKSGMGLIGAAIGSSISYFVLFLGLFIFIQIKSNCSMSNWKKEITAMCCPFPVMIGIMAALQYASGGPAAGDYVIPFLNLTVFLCTMFLVLGFGIKRYSLLGKDNVLNTGGGI